jgi:branched-subunit amino acid aminotransferase/4-amino-4-deoxychorismate lyase
VNAAAGCVLTWHPAAGLRPDQSGPAVLVAADSWLAENGKARGLDLHRARFTAACVEAGGLQPSEVDRFWRAVLIRLPRTGEWFPRAELVAEPAGTRLRLRIRPAPARTAEAVVWAGAGGDPRAVPRRKGPDLDRLAAICRRAAVAGANEALLTTPSGLVLEGANSALLWWEGDRLCVPDPSLRLLPSVTAALIRREAGERGIEVHHSRRRLAELAGREVWLANALHGIRPVAGWVGSTVPTGVPARAAQWRHWWDTCAEVLPGHAAADVNSDHRTDLVTANPADEWPMIRLNAGAGN